MFIKGNFGPGFMFIFSRVDRSHIQDVKLALLHLISLLAQRDLNMQVMFIKFSFFLHRNNNY